MSTSTEGPEKRFLREKQSHLLILGQNFRLHRTGLTTIVSINKYVSETDKSRTLRP